MSLRLDIKPQAEVSPRPLAARWLRTDAATGVHLGNWLNCISGTATESVESLPTEENNVTDLGLLLAAFALAALVSQGSTLVQSCFVL